MSSGFLFLGKKYISTKAALKGIAADLKEHHDTVLKAVMAGGPKKSTTNSPVGRSIPAMDVPPPPSATNINPGGWR